MSTTTARTPNLTLKLPAGAEYFVIIFIAGLATRLYGLGQKPFWMDELTTIHRASLPLIPLIANSIFFHQLPSYFIVTSWALPLGQTEFFVRLPAALFGALSCALAFGAARTLAGNRAGLAAGFLTASSPAMVQYGQEARSYSMLICAILISLWGLLALAKSPARASQPLHTLTAPKAAWAAYTIGAALALNILPDALFWLLSANIAALAIVLHPKAQKRPFAQTWLLSQALTLIASLPWFLAIKLFGQRGALGGLDWVQPLTIPRLWWSFASTYLFYTASLIKVRLFAPAIPGLGFLVLFLAILGLWRLRHKGAATPVLIAAILILPIALTTISLITPILMPRYLLWGSAPYLIGAACGLTAIPQRLQPTALAIFILLSLLNLRPYYTEETKPLWNQAATILSTQYRPGDLVLVDDPQAATTIQLYLHRQNSTLQSFPWTKSIPTAQAALTAGHRIWAIQGPIGQSDHESQSQFLSRIAPLGAPTQSQHAGLDILIDRFNRTRA